MTAPVMVHRCDVCGKWSHAVRQPKWHQKLVLDELPEGAEVVVDLSNGWSGDPEDRDAWYVKCGPFTSFRVMPLDPADAHPGLVEWLARGDRGLSSKAIVEQLVLGGGNIAHPYDPGDFRRCEMLLRAVPTLRPLLPRMAEVSPEWARLVKRWPDIVYALDSECPGWAKDRPRGLAYQAHAIITGCLRDDR